MAWRLQTFTALWLNIELDRNHVSGRTTRRERRKRFCHSVTVDRAAGRSQLTRTRAVAFRCDQLTSDMKTKDSDPEFIATETLIVGDIARSVTFYRDVLGATVLREGEPTLLRLKNTWIIINKAGGPTDDKPEVIASPPKDLNTLSSFLNLRVVDIDRCYRIWGSRGAHFITDPKIHATEKRCYMRDPDGYLIEVGQTTTTATPLESYR